MRPLPIEGKCFWQIVNMNCILWIRHLLLTLVIINQQELARWDGTQFIQVVIEHSHERLCTIWILVQMQIKLIRRVTVVRPLRKLLNDKGENSTHICPCGHYSRVELCSIRGEALSTENPLRSLETNKVKGTGSTDSFKISSYVLRWTQ